MSTQAPLIPGQGGTFPSSSEQGPPVILASASPRRRVLLERTGFSLRVCPQEVDESPRPGEHPKALVARLAQAKSEAGLTAEALAPPVTTRDGGDYGKRPKVVVAADTVVVYEGRILGKPRHEDDACEMLTSLGGRWHEVYGGWSVVRGPTEGIGGVAVTRVRFKELRPAEIAWYLDTGAWRDKAGAYGIQGLGAFLVAHIEGSYSNVVGLPLSDVVDALAVYGLFPSPMSGKARAEEVLR